MRKEDDTIIWELAHRKGDWICDDCGDRVPIEDRSKHRREDCQALSDTSTPQDRV